MARLFRDLATKDGIYVDARLPVLYVSIERTLNWFHASTGDRSFRKKGDGTVELTYAQVYGYVPGARGRWDLVVEAAIEEFWTRTWDHDALADFCDFETFEQMMYIVCDRAKSRHLKSQHVKKEPEPMVWNRDGHRRRRTGK